MIYKAPNRIRARW